MKKNDRHGEMYSSYEVCEIIQDEMSPLIDTIYMLLHHLPNVPNYKNIKDKAKTTVNQFKKHRNMTEQTAKRFWNNVQKDIDKIKVQQANFEYIAQTGTINGTLLTDLTRLLGEKQIEIDKNELFQRLLKYSSTYEISFQMWPSQYTIYICKGGVDLYSFGGGDTPEETMKHILEYLDRINKVKAKV